MSADNLIRIKLKKNGLYQVRHESASSLVHTLAGIKPKEEELLLKVMADDIKGYSDALKEAKKFLEEMEDEGREVEYGIVGEEWKK